MLLLSVTVLLIPALCTAANPPGYGWSPYVYGGGNSYGGYQQQLYGGYQQQPYGGYSNYHYSQSNSHGYTPSWSGIAYGFRNYVYPAYQYLPRQVARLSITTVFLELLNVQIVIMKKKVYKWLKKFEKFFLCSLADRRFLLKQLYSVSTSFPETSIQI